uniref:Nucleoporin Nup159/Nup146 N-terminal domain-containing protein n=1 Tax=Eptatretus burgeri TaxID=7764 RepID=A0A8C4R7R2_EPTBU
MSRKQPQTKNWIHFTVRRFDFQFKQMKRLRILEPPDELPCDRVSLLAVSNRFGLVFIGAPNSLRILSSAAVQNTNTIGGDINECPLAFPAQRIAISADEVTLVVAAAGTDGARLSFFDIRAFANTVSEPFGVVQLGSGSGEVVIDMVWNPGQPNLLAVCTDAGSLVLLSIGDTIITTGCLPPNTGVTAVCWSPKGKQLVCGKVNGTMTQYSQVRTYWDETSYLKFNCGVFTVLDVKWVNTHVFIVAYVEFHGSPDASPELIVVTLPKKDERTTENFLSFAELFYGNSQERQPQFYLQYIDEWCANFITLWELWNLEDACRAELPLSENGEDTFPMGIAVDNTSQIPIPVGKILMLTAVGSKKKLIFQLLTQNVNAPIISLPLLPTVVSILRSMFCYNWPLLYLSATVDPHSPAPRPVSIPFRDGFILMVIYTSATEGGGYVFTPFCLFVCLFVCVQAISKSWGRIRIKFCGQVWCVIRKN